MLFVAIITTTAFAAPIPAPSTITAATVYADRAVVTRTAHLDLPAGESELTFTGLPKSLLENSLQVSGHGTAATILDVVARIIPVELTADPRVKAIEDELAALKRQDRTLEDKLAATVGQQALLSKIETAATQPATKEAAVARPNFEDWQKLLTFSAENAARIAADRQSLEQERADLARKIESAKARLEQLGLQGQGQPATTTVSVRVAATQAGPLDLSLDYAVPAAAWTPDYTARFHSDQHEIELTYFGLVINATGEDWKNIALTLSTACPNLGGKSPEPEPWIVDVMNNNEKSRRDGFGLFSKKPRRPDPSATTIGPEGGLSGVALGLADAAGLSDATTSIALATLDTSVSSASFKIPTTATILSDNTPQKVGIANALLTANPQYDTAPKLLEVAFLSANTVNSTDFPLLAGNVSTFVDNTFVATGQLKTTMPGEKFTLSLGADEGVSIKRKIVSRFTEDTGFTTRSRRTTYDILVTVTNNKRTTERVVIKDAVPVARDEKIVVKLLTPAERDLLKPEEVTAQPPKLGIARDADGKLTWRLDLKPGEKRELPLKFSIEHPADLPVTGVE